jgi:hypothetical protein
MERSLWTSDTVSVAIPCDNVIYTKILGYEFVRPENADEEPLLWKMYVPVCIIW